jgi:hypothetical protein
MTDDPIAAQRAKDEQIAESSARIYGELTLTEAEFAQWTAAGWDGRHENLSQICECERWRDGIDTCPLHGTHRGHVTA